MKRKELEQLVENIVTKVLTEDAYSSAIERIAKKSGLRKDNLDKWFDKYEIKLNVIQLEKDIDNKKFNVLDLVSAVSGTPDNKYEQDIVKKYQLLRMY
jgi:formyltetrahydrofolate synthetase